MKKIITTLLLFVSMFAFAQGGAMADLKFEEAEIAFNNQNYETTIKKLDEFDKLLGSVKDKSLYLYLNNADRETVESFTGELPPHNSVHSFFRRLAQLGLTSQKAAVK